MAMDSGPIKLAPGPRTGTTGTTAPMKKKAKKKKAKKKVAASD
jgi:hypothetical protein